MPSDSTIKLWYMECREIEKKDYFGALQLLLGQENINFANFPVQKQIKYFSEKYKTEIWKIKIKKQQEADNEKLLTPVCSADMKKEELKSTREIINKFKRQMRWD